MDEIHINHIFQLKMAEIFSKIRNDVRILDFGCGSGTVLLKGRELGYNILGADIFYEKEPALKNNITKMGYPVDILSEIKDGKLEYEDNYFDLVMSNQVFEHIEDFDSVLHEIKRVLKKNGYLFCIFPPKESIVEWHIGFPLVHWFPKGSKIRFYYALILRYFRFGFYKRHLSKIQWVKENLEYLDKYTYYKSIKEIRSTFSKYFNFRFMKYQITDFKVDRSQLSTFSKLLQNPFLLKIFRLFQNFWNLMIIASKK